ncbi:phage portal protein [Corynebacterium sp. HMSC11E11]|uniref:phage portal protein n=1 Tax=Corynebacterium sp. HMSC11E11 TaxID=1581089 RepID=UPI0008A32598|nr:phage portal protein [Corynebacterium sp. HMSC11E11]OFU59358.1 hypothetical protein HMPREF3121_01260 [Corynebacterium sp. HMSC11E11]
MNEGQAREAVRALLIEHAAQRRRYDTIDRAVRPWSDAEAARRMDVQQGKNFHRHLKIAKMSQTPFLGLVLDTYGQSLKVDNFFSSGAKQAPAWQWWQTNRMNARQTGLHRAALEYGTAYASVLPAAGGAARIGVHSPRRMVAFYGEPFAWPGEGSPSSEEFPIIALAIQGRHIRLYDENDVYYFGAEHVPGDPLEWGSSHYLTDANLPYLEARPHGVGVTPIVRYQDRMMADGEETRGIIEHLLALSDRIDTTNYQQGVAQYWSAFKQRYVLGWMPKTEQDAMRQSASDTWFFGNKDVKVGQFDSTDLSQYTEARQATVRDLAATAQVPAQSLGANAISNISADGLAALETSKDRKASEIQTSLGESHEQLLRLCAHITGDSDGAADFGAEVKWAETSSRSFAQTVDGLGKLASLLGVPQDELWADIPGWTRERVERARARTATMPSLATGLFDPDDEEPTVASG